MKKKIALIGDGSVSDQVRSWAMQPYFEEAGYDTKIIHIPIMGGEVDLPQCDLAIYSRPMGPEIMEFYNKLKIPVLADQDDDFAAIPASHVGFKNIGRGNPKNLKRHHNSLKMADYLIVSTDVIKDRFKALGIKEDRITVIGNGWDDRNPLWRQGHRNPDTLVIGWGGTITHRQDFELIYEPVTQFLKENDVCIAIAGDPAIYKKFWTVPEKNKLFVSMLPYKYYPHFLNGLDVLLVPLVDDYFNQAKSDIKLVEAGATSLPWIASNTLQYARWARGGFLCSTPEDWFNALTMFKDDYTRKLYADQGRDMAELRRFSVLSKYWLEVVKDLT